MLRIKLGGTAAGLLLLFGAADAIAAADSDQSSQVRIASAAEASAKSTVVEQVKSTVDRLNVRKEPKLTATVIQLIGKDRTFQVLDKQGKWVKIKLANGEGWAHGDYLEYVKTASKPQQPAQKPVEPPAKKPAVVIVDVTNLRSGPGTNYRILAKAQPGDTFPIVVTEGDWHKILRPDGSHAYVAGWVVKTESVSVNSQVFIYHTHNRESWKYVARNKTGSAIDDPDTNISLVGKQLGSLLNKKGISATADNGDIYKRLADQKLGYSSAYMESRKVVDAAVKANPSLGFFFDIHRDGDVPRSLTTESIGGKSYARILFVIGTGHSDYAQNKKFAEALDGLMDKKYPGLSRGVMVKDAKEGNGEYNQSVSPGSLLLEVGGANNTLQESLLAAEAFADVFAEYLKSK